MPNRIRKKVGLVCPQCGLGPYFGKLALTQHIRAVHQKGQDEKVVPSAPLEDKDDESLPDSPTL